MGIRVSTEGRLLTGICWLRAANGGLLLVDDGFDFGPQLEKVPTGVSGRSQVKKNDESISSGALGGGGGRGSGGISSPGGGGRRPTPKPSQEDTQWLGIAVAGRNRSETVSI
jgi:hypothetical protein